MTKLDYKEILFKIRPSNRDLWTVSIAVVLFGVVCVVALFELFGIKPETLAIISGLFTALWTGRFLETINVRKKINNALKGKMVT